MDETAIWMTVCAILAVAVIVAYRKVFVEQKDMKEWKAWKEVFKLLKENFVQLDHLMTKRDIPFSELHAIATNLVFEGLSVAPGLTDVQKQRFSREMIGSIIEKPLASWYVQQHKKK